MGNPIHPVPSRRGRRPSSGSTADTSAARSPPSTRSTSVSSLDGDASEGGIDQPAGRVPPPAPGHTLEAPTRRWKTGRRSRSVQLFQSLRRALPVLAPRCARLPAGLCQLEAAPSAADSHLSHVMSFSGAAGRPCRRVTGTLFGHRKGRVALSLQETPRCLPTLVVELALQTNALLRELANPTGARIVMEAERRAADAGDGTGKRRGHAQLLDEPAWTMFCNGRKTGFAVRRAATDDDLAVMETLRAVSMGAGVLPGKSSDEEGQDGEVAYMRGGFDHFVGSRDSESLYMVAPQGGGTGPELAIFFVRL